jgi:hypothetical protein
MISVGAAQAGIAFLTGKNAYSKSGTDGFGV